MERQNNRVKIGNKPYIVYLGAAMAMFERFDDIELSASGRGLDVVSRMLFSLARHGVKEMNRRTEIVRGDGGDDDTYTRVIVTLRRNGDVSGA